MIGAANYRPDALILRSLRTDGESVALLLLSVHLPVQFLSFLKDAHEFGVHFFAAQSLQNVFLVFELVLRLLCLLGPLLLLNQTESILSRWLLLGAGLVDVLAVRLSSDFVLRGLGLAV